MAQHHQKPTRARAQPGTARVRWLVVSLALAALSCALIAILTDDDARAVFGGMALVFALAAIWSGIEIATAAPSEPSFDLEAPPPATPLPQSPVTQTYEPKVPPNKSLERTRER
jgi:hypothetical protein